MVAGPFNVLLLFARLSSLGSSVWSPPLVCPSGCSSERSFQDKDRGGGLRHAVRGRSILEHARGLHGGLAFNSVTGSLRQLHTSVLVVLADVICVEEDYLCVQYNKLEEELQTDKKCTKESSGHECNEDKRVRQLRSQIYKSCSSSCSRI